MRAMGNPVALLASAELRETRGFTSMIWYSGRSGWSANWMLQPPWTFSARITLMLAVRSIW